jgi:hypothetical protein
MSAVKRAPIGFVDSAVLTLNAIAVLAQLVGADWWGAGHALAFGVVFWAWSAARRDYEGLLTAIRSVSRPYKGDAS